MFYVISGFVILYGLYSMIAGFVAADNFGEGLLIFVVQLIVVAVGIFAAYVSALLTYGFAEIITNTKKTKESCKCDSENSESKE